LSLRALWALGVLGFWGSGLDWSWDMRRCSGSADVGCKDPGEGPRLLRWISGLGLGFFRWTGMRDSSVFF
jgi:hypothetical protein